MNSLVSPSKRLRLDSSSQHFESDSYISDDTVNEAQTVLNDSNAVSQILSFLSTLDLLYFKSEPITKSFNKALDTPTPWSNSVSLTTWRKELWNRYFHFFQFNYRWKRVKSIMIATSIMQHLQPLCFHSLNALQHLSLLISPDQSNSVSNATHILQSLANNHCKLETLELIQRHTSLVRHDNITDIIKYILKIEIRHLHIFILSPLCEYYLLAKYEYPLTLNSLILPSIFDDSCVPSTLICDFLSIFPNLNKLHLIGFGPFAGMCNSEFCAYICDKSKFALDLRANIQRFYAQQYADSTVSVCDANSQQSSHIYSTPPQIAADSNGSEQRTFPLRRKRWRRRKIASLKRDTTTTTTTNSNELHFSYLPICDISLNVWNYFNDELFPVFIGAISKSQTLRRIRLCRLMCPRVSLIDLAIKQPLTAVNECMSRMIELISALFSTRLEIFDLMLSSRTCDFILWTMLDYVHLIRCVHIGYGSDVAIPNETILDLFLMIPTLHICAKKNRNMGCEVRITVILKAQPSSIHTPKFAVLSLDDSDYSDWSAPEGSNWGDTSPNYSCSSATPDNDCENSVHSSPHWESYNVSPVMAMADPLTSAVAKMQQRRETILDRFNCTDADVKSSFRQSSQQQSSIFETNESNEFGCLQQSSRLSQSLDCCDNLAGDSDVLLCKILSKCENAANAAKVASEQRCLRAEQRSTIMTNEALKTKSKADESNFDCCDMDSELGSIDAMSDEMSVGDILSELNSALESSAANDTTATTTSSIVNNDSNSDLVGFGCGIAETDNSPFVNCVLDSDTPQSKSLNKWLQLTCNYFVQWK